MRIGAEILVQTLLSGGVEVCFANPGTSEMHFVGALDGYAAMRCVPALFEGVVTGAADGYYRMAEKPAATLLHLAPGLGNAVANLHNAKKARSGIVNIVGDHTTYFSKMDSPLGGDIEGLARPFSNWVRTTIAVEHLATDAAEAIRVARASPGGIATLILPADISWSRGADPVAVMLPPRPRTPVPQSVVSAAAEALKAGGSSAVLLLGDVGLRGRALEYAGRIASATGCRLLAEVHNARIERGAGRVAVARIPATQPVDAALAHLADTRELVLAGAMRPLVFFAYPGRPTELAPPSANVRTLADPAEDVTEALAGVLEYLGAHHAATVRAPLDLPSAAASGPITREGIGQIIAALMPENAIVADESITSGRSIYAQCTTSRPHDWLASRGGSIGFALPQAIGASIAAPHRRVLALTGDGSAMYTLQSLWTMARENLRIATVVFSNGGYSILKGEFANMGIGAPGPAAEAILSMTAPPIDWRALARGHGVESGRATCLEEFSSELSRAFAIDGPYLIEVVMP